MIILLLTASLAFSQNVLFDSLPQTWQLYPRGGDDSGTVVISGRVAGAGADSIVVDVLKTGKAYAHQSALLSYSNDTAAFRLSFRLVSELSEYAFTIRRDTQTVRTAENVACGDVILVTGQSNAEAGGSGAFTLGEWVRSAGYVQAGNGYRAAWGVATYLCCTAPGAGMLGTNLGKFLALSNRTPICVLNGAVSGTVIEQHQRNDANPVDVNTLYGRLLLRAQVAGLAAYAKSMLYFQGEYHNGYQSYPGYFDALYKDWKSDYPALQKVYVEQVNTGCDTNVNANIRDIQRRFGETYDDVTVMAACGVREYTGCHYGINGYAQIAQWWYPVYNRDLYGAPDTAHYTSPKILRAGWGTPDKRSLDLVFDMPVVWPEDTLGYKMKDYIILDRNWGLIDSARVFENIVRLYLSAAVNPTTVSYVPISYYRNNPNSIYMGPYIRNTRGIGALTFLDFPVDTGYNAAETVLRPASNLSMELRPNPFTSCFSVRVPEPAGKVSVYDSRGRLVHVVPVNRRNLMLNGTDFAPGVYFVEYRAPGIQLQKKAVLAR